MLVKDLFQTGFIEAPGIFCQGFEVQMICEKGVLADPLKLSVKERAIEVTPRCPRPERVI